MSILFVAGSPSPRSRTESLLDQLGGLLERRGQAVSRLSLAGLPAQPLLNADANDAALAAALTEVETARTIVFGTPIYKASFSGLLKTFLDLLPQSGLVGKTVLPIATGGSNAHFLALDYGLRPVLQSLSPRVVLPSIYANEKQIVRHDSGHVELDETLLERLNLAVEQIAEHASARLSPRHFTSATGMCIDRDRSPAAVRAA